MVQSGYVFGGGQGADTGKEGDPGVSSPRSMGCCRVFDLLMHSTMLRILPECPGLSLALCPHIREVRLCKSRCSGPHGDSQPRPARQVSSEGGQERSSSHQVPHAHASPQATPPCLGSLAPGQPCAEAVERDVPLAEAGVGHWALRPTFPLATTTDTGGQGV